MSIITKFLIAPLLHLMFKYFLACLFLVAQTPALYEPCAPHMKEFTGRRIVNNNRNFLVAYNDDERFQSALSFTSHVYVILCGLCLKPSNK